MSRYIVLLKFTEKGVAHVGKSLGRADDFRATAQKAGATVEGQFWTIGPYDGAIILNAPDEKTAAGLVLHLGESANISTCMLRAFDAEEFKGVLERAGA